MKNNSDSKIIISNSDSDNDNSHIVYNNTRTITRKGYKCKTSVRREKFRYCYLPDVYLNFLSLPNTLVDISFA